MVKIDGGSFDGEPPEAKSDDRGGDGEGREVQVGAELLADEGDVAERRWMGFGGLERIEVLLSKLVQLPLEVICEKERQ